ncbi:MAG: hypothetical protein U0Q12_23045 [Vicinamibacterales bacterium]
MGRMAIKVMVLGLLLNAVWNVGPVFWHAAQFEDEVLEVAKLSSRSSKDEVLTKVLMLAERHRLPLDAGDVAIDRQQQRTAIKASMQVDLKYFPTKTYPWRFDVDVEGTPPRLSAVP